MHGQISTSISAQISSYSEHHYSTANFGDPQRSSTAFEKAVNGTLLQQTYFMYHYGFRRLGGATRKGPKYWNMKQHGMITREWFMDYG
jgi:hypothetical protein